MEECPKCNTSLKEEDVLKYGDSGIHKIVDTSKFCPNRKCDYEK